MVDISEATDVASAAKAAARKLGWDGVVFWLVETVPIWALVIAAVLMLAAAIKRHRRKLDAAHMAADNGSAGEWP